jgi:hypothetical protein
MSQLQVNQVKDKAKTKKKQNDQTTKQSLRMNQRNYFNPYQATSILLQISNERVEIAPLNSIDGTRKYVNHTLNVLIIAHHPDNRRRESSRYLYV